MFGFGPLTARKIQSYWNVFRKEQEDGEGTRKQNIGGVAEGTGTVYSGEEEAEGRPHRSLQLPERRLQQEGCRSLSSGAKQ